MFSLYLLNRLQCCRSRFTLNGPRGFGRSTLQRQNTCAQRLYCSSNGNHTSDDGGDGGDGAIATGNPVARGIGGTLIMVQQGIEIHELPMLVKRMGKGDMIMMTSNEKEIGGLEANSGGNKAFEFDTTTENEIFEELGPIYHSTNGVLGALENSTSGESIIFLFECISMGDYENEVLYPIMKKLLVFGKKDELLSSEASCPYYHQLLLLLCKDSDTKSLLDILMVLLETRPYMANTIDTIGQELIVRNSNACLSIVETCESIEHLVRCKRNWLAEKFWSGLADQEQSINADNIKFIFEILPKLHASRRTIVRILDRVMENVFPMMKPKAVCEILRALKQTKNGHTKCIIQTITRWLNTNIQSLTEDELETIVHCLNELPFSDANAEMAIERFMKAKATRIKSQNLIVEIARHVSLFRLMNPIILDGCAEFTVHNFDRIDPLNIRNIMRPYGLISFQPKNAMAFWDGLERYLDHNFDKIPPADVIDIVLGVILLEMFPRNQIDQLFTRYFMHKLHSVVTLDKLAFVRERLQLIDTAMTLEFKDYHGPLLPRNDSHRVFMDYRAKCLLNDNVDIIERIAGGKEFYTQTTMLKELPTNNLYIIDLLFHPSGMKNFIGMKAFDMTFDYNGFTAALVHMPEHYVSGQKHLIGAQNMRIRHFRRLGLKVMSLNYEKIRKLNTHKTELHEYFVEQMKNALPPLAD